MATTPLSLSRQRPFIQLRRPVETTLLDSHNPQTDHVLDADTDANDDDDDDDVIEKKTVTLFSLLSNDFKMTQIKKKTYYSI